jgi:hypothetical protein
MSGKSSRMLGRATFEEPLILWEETKTEKTGSLV